ncbi:MAG: hypothetical protein MHM6MM_006880 [Cercozoa sp. M6MM]
MTKRTYNCRLNLGRAEIPSATIVCSHVSKINMQASRALAAVTRGVQVRLRGYKAPQLRVPVLGTSGVFRLSEDREALEVPEWFDEAPVTFESVQQRVQAAFDKHGGGENFRDLEHKASVLQDIERECEVPLHSQFLRLARDAESTSQIVFTALKKRQERAVHAASFVHEKPPNVVYTHLYPDPDLKKVLPKHHTPKKTTPGPKQVESYMTPFGYKRNPYANRLQLAPEFIEQVYSPTGVERRQKALKYKPKMFRTNFEKRIG